MRHADTLMRASGRWPGSVRLLTLPTAEGNAAGVRAYGRDGAALGQRERGGEDEQLTKEELTRRMETAKKRYGLR